MLNWDTTKKYMFINILINIAEFLVDSFATIYLLEKGVTYSQIGIIWALYLGVTAITDYPTGGFSDKYGRRKIYAIGIFLTSFSYFLLLSDAIWILCISYMLKGLGTSFISGSLTAWLSCDLNSDEKFKNTMAKTSLFTNVCSFILPFLFFLHQEINLNYIFLLSAVIHLFIGIFSICFLAENYGSQEEISFIYLNTIKYFLKNRILIFITFANVTVYLFFTIFYYIWQPISKDIFINLKFLPICYALYMLFSGISAYFVKFCDKLKVKKLMILTMLIYGGSFANFYVADKFKSCSCLVIAMILFGIGAGIVFMLVNIYTNENSPKEYKASLNSLISSICTIVNIVFQFVFGEAMELYGIDALTIYGMLLAIFLAMGFGFMKEVSETKLEKL